MIAKGTEARARLGRTMYDVYKDGRSIRVIAQQFGLTYGQARTILMETGMPLRSRGESQRR